LTSHPLYPQDSHLRKADVRGGDMRKFILYAIPTMFECKYLVYISRPKFLGAYSNQLRLRHTFCTKKMNASCWQGGIPLTPVATSILGGGK